MRKELHNIYLKYEKVKIEKNKILGWVYFQIQLKEKTLTLPNHYILFLENINEIDDYYKKIKIINERSAELTQINCLKDNIRTNIHSSSLGKKDKQKKTVRRN